MTIWSGTAPFSTSGSYRFLPSAIDGSYAIVPISGNTGASTGTYFYSKTGATAAKLSFIDTEVGELIATCSFSTPNSGTYTVTSIALPVAKKRHLPAQQHPY